MYACSFTHMYLFCVTYVPEKQVQSTSRLVSITKKNITQRNNLNLISFVFSNNIIISYSGQTRYVKYNLCWTIKAYTKLFLFIELALENKKKLLSRRQFKHQCSDTPNSSSFKHMTDQNGLMKKITRKKLMFYLIFNINKCTHIQLLRKCHPIIQFNPVHGCIIKIESF